MQRIIIATGNKGKVKEFKSIAPELDFITIKEFCPSLDFDPEETGSSFQENALIKAQAAASLVQEEALIMADDSGIEIEALDGRPGIYAARYLKEHGIEGILKELGDNPNRACRFVCHITIVNQDGNVVFETEQYWQGNIASEARGNNGFGYDPIVIPQGYENQTVAELDDEIKSKLSHRAQAALAAIEGLKAKEA